MLQDSDYTIHAQYKYLTFFHQCIAPQLGVFPQECPQQRYMSILTPYAVPLELSINYPRSLVRFSCEPVSPLAGTDLDPFNKGRLEETFEKFLRAAGEPYTKCYEHLLRKLVISDEEARELMRTQGDKIPSQSRGRVILSADMGKDGEMMCVLLPVHEVSRDGQQGYGSHIRLNPRPRYKRRILCLFVFIRIIPALLRERRRVAILLAPLPLNRHHRPFFRLHQNLLYRRERSLRHDPRHLDTRRDTHRRSHAQGPTTS